MDLYFINIIDLFIGGTKPIEKSTKARGIIDCLSGYTLQKKITDGGNSIVFKGVKKDKSTQQQYAFKFIKECSSDSSEMHYSRLLSQYNIGPTLIDTRVTSIGLGLIVTELWDTPLWVDMIYSIYIHPPEHIISKIKNQIDQLHKLGLVHGDITGKNILVKFDGPHIIDATVADFGSVLPHKEWEGDVVAIYKFMEYHKKYACLRQYYEDNLVDYEDVCNDPFLLDKALIYYWEK